MAAFVENPDWRDQIRQDQIELLQRLSAAGLEKARRACPVDTGELHGSLRKVVDAGTLSAAWGTDVEYGLYVEEGHRVAYRDAETGDVVFTGNVVPPQPFLRPSLYDLGPEVVDIGERER